MQYGLYFVSCLFILQVCSIISIIYELNISLNSLVELVDGTSVECLCLFMAVQFEHLAAVMEQDGRALFLSEKTHAVCCDTPNLQMLGNRGSMD